MTTIPPRGLYALKASRAIDVRTGEPIEPVVIVVEQERIKEIGARVRPPAAAQVVDLGDATLVPGLHDNHCHLMLEPKNFDGLIYKRSSAAKTLDAMLNAQKALMSGFTFLRDPGDCDQQYGLVDLKRALEQETIAGPRLRVAPHFLSPTGGHGDANDFAPELHMAGLGHIVDGVESMRRAVREEIKYGADWIKIFVSGGILSKGDDPSYSTYSFEEVRVAAEEAHRLGRRITAHAHGAEAIRWCVEAGFDGVEHCTMADSATIALMKQKGVFAVPTLYVLDFILSEHKKLELTPDLIEKARLMKQFQRDRFSEIVRVGAPVAYGTDIGIYVHGENWRDFSVMIECGMKPIDAIRTATLNSAKMIGLEADVGTLEPGKLADVVAVDGNPLKDIAALSRARFVMRGGRIYKNERST